MRSWSAKTIFLCLSLALGLSGQAWAQSASPAPGKTTPIIDIVAVVPGADHAKKVKATQPVDLKAAKVLGSSGSLDLDRRLASDSAGQGQSAPPNLLVGNGAGLDGRLESMSNWNASSGSVRPLSGIETRLDDQDPQGGFLAFKLPAGFMGDFLLGGGYTRSHSATSSGAGSSSAPRGALASVRGAESTTYDSAGRWGAFLAVPYQITNRVGVRPEFSYYYGDNANLGAEAGNEWVMGLRFTFGF